MSIILVYSKYMTVILSVSKQKERRKMKIKTKNGKIGERENVAGRIVVEPDAVIVPDEACMKRWEGKEKVSNLRARLENTPLQIDVYDFVAPDDAHYPNAGDLWKHAGEFEYPVELFRERKLGPLSLGARLVSADSPYELSKGSYSLKSGDETPTDYLARVISHADNTLRSTKLPVKFGRILGTENEYGLQHGIASLIFKPRRTREESLGRTRQKVITESGWFYGDNSFDSETGAVFSFANRDVVGRFSEMRYQGVTFEPLEIEETRIGNYRVRGE
jgi:hypothetical protein